MDHTIVGHTGVLRGLSRECQPLLSAQGDQEVLMDTPDTIVLVSVDDLRYDALGCSELDEWLDDYGALQHRETPTFDALADDALSVPHTSSGSSYTPPSHATMFTGQYPKEHGVKTFYNTYADDTTTLAELLRDRGYDTAAWIENMALEMLDVTRGFDEVVCPFEDPDANLFDFVDRAAAHDGRTFVLIHLFDVHKPYCYTPGGSERERYNDDLYAQMEDILPDGFPLDELREEAAMEAADTVPNYDDLTPSLREYATNWSLDYLLRKELEAEYGEDRFQYLVRLYQEGVATFDRGRFADLLDDLRATLLSDYLLLVTSDHGEARCTWQDREDFMNSFNVSEQAVRVPMFVDTDVESLPDSYDGHASHVDIFPTIAEVLDDDVGASVAGSSILSNLDEPPAERPVFQESWFYTGGPDFFGNISETGDGGLSEVAVTRDGYKLRRSFEATGSPERALYDIDADPFERTDVSGDAPEVLSSLEAVLEEYLSDVDRRCTPDVTPEASDEISDRLKALGYLE